MRAAEADSPPTAAEYPGSVAYRVVITLAALLIFLLGRRIPIPGVDPRALSALQHGGGLGVERISIFALGVTPLFSAMLLAEITKLFAPALRRWESADAANRYTLNRMVLIVGLLFAMLQARGIAYGLEGITALVSEPGPMFRVSCIMSLIAGTALVAWLADQISRHGLGSGFWLLFIAQLLAGPSVSIAELFELQARGTISTQHLILAAPFFVLATALLVGAIRGTGGSDTNAGAWLWAPILAYAVLSWLLAAIILVARGHGADLGWLAPGQPFYLALLALLVFAVVYLQARSLRLGSDGALQVPPAVVAGVLIVVLLAGELLSHQLGVPLPVGARSLVIITVVMQSVLAVLRPRGNV